MNWIDYTLIGAMILLYLVIISLLIALVYILTLRKNNKKETKQ